MDPTLLQLEALDAIARCGSFGAAAAELNRVPSALSYLIKNLELEAGLSLFDRTHRRATLTPTGRRLLEQARLVLKERDGLTALASELRSGWEPELRVVVDGALPLAPVIRAIRAFAEPEVPTFLRLDVEYQEGVLHRFEQGAELALVLGFEGGGGEEGLHCTPLGELVLLLVAASDHPIASSKREDLDQHNHVELLVRDSAPAFEVDRKPSFMGNRNVMFLSDFQTKKTALLGGAGYGWMPAHLIADSLATGALVHLEQEVNRWTYFPQLVRRPDQPLGRAAQLFIANLCLPFEALVATE
ncbi:MAG: LysR family transcriptional regulator [Myxococcota bacterium]|nr:LysR family transcriptional regulator [Myxococcota bacterium]